MSDDKSLIVAPAIPAIMLSAEARNHIANALAAVGPATVINDAASYSASAENVKKLAALRIDMEKQRKAAKEPILEAGRQLDKAVADAIQPVIEREKAISAEMIAHSQRVEAERQRVEAENRRLAEEAAERERLAQEQRDRAAAEAFQREQEALAKALAEQQAKLAAQREAEAELGLDEAPPPALELPPTPAPVPLPPPEPARLILPVAPALPRAAGTTLRTRLVPTVTNESEVPRDLCSSDTQKINGYLTMNEDRLRKALADAKATELTENGITYRLETSLSTRR